MDKRAEEFFELVKEMRDTQKQYFKTRDSNFLNKSKELEKAVDKALDEYEESKYGERLF